MTIVGDEHLIRLESGTISVDALLQRMQRLEAGILHLREVNGQTPAGAEVTLTRCGELLRQEPGVCSVIVDLTEAVSKPGSAYREYMAAWAERQPAFHAAYVLPPVGAITRMALRFVIGRMMAGHPNSTSSLHDTFDEALAEAQRRRGSLKRNA